MTLIVSPALFKSKATLQQHLNEGCRIEDPSIVNPWVKLSTELPVGFSDVVTNHPLRSKFAEIKRTSNGWKVS